MKIVLRVIAVYFAVAFVATLLEVIRFASSVSPNALKQLGFIGMLTIAGWGLGILVGPFAAVQLWRLKNIGRWAGILLFGFVALSGILDAAYYGGMPLPLLLKVCFNIVGCVILLLPAAHRVCTDSKAYSTSPAYS